MKHPSFSRPNPPFLKIIGDQKVLFIQAKTNNLPRMNSHFGRTMLLSLFCILSTTIHAQDSIPALGESALNNTSLDIAQLTPEDYSKLTLPPLSTFLDAAANCTQIGYLKATKDSEVGNLLTTKREWMNSFRVFGNYQYGALGANVTSASQSSQTVVYSGQVQSIYNGGVAISLPVDVIYDRKNRISKQQSKINQVDYQIQQAIEDIKLVIAETYIAALQQLSTLKVRAESVVLANSDIKLTQAEYLNGNVALAELNYRKTMQATAVSNYEETRAQLNKAILHLELLTKIKIIKK